MSLKIQNNEDEGFSLLPNFRASKPFPWRTIVEQEIRKGKLKVRKCSCYSASTNENLNDETKCICGRLARRHSFTGEPKTEYRTAKKWVAKLATEEDVTVYGQLRSGARVCKSLIIMLYNS